MTLPQEIIRAKRDGRALTARKSPSSSPASRPAR